VSEREGGHVPPFYCPYCGEEDIRPWGEQHGEWLCGSCRRVWLLRHVGSVTQTRVQPAAPTGGPR
jgi:transposase-like protein